MEEEIVIKFKKFISVLRSEAEKLTDEERKCISNLDDFFPPCQLMIIVFGKLPEKYLVVTHNETLKDLEIKLHCIEPWNAIDELEKISRYPQWDKEFTEKEKQRLWRVSNYKELIEGQLIGIIRQMENSLYRKPPEKFFGGKTLLHERDFKWEIYDVKNFNPEKEANKILEQAKNQLKADKLMEQQPVKRESALTIQDKISGYGSYFYLPVWLNEYPELSFREKIRGTKISFYFQKESITDTYRGITVVIEENGYIGICTDNRQIANRCLNEIMGTGLLFGLPFFSVRDGDMSEFSFQRDKIGSRTIIPRGNILRQFDRNRSFWEPDVHPHLSIEEEGFRQLLKMAEMISNESEISDCVILFVESYTCLQSSQYIQSFIVSWTIIEKFLYWIWEAHLKSKGVNRARRDRLTGIEWSISRVIEMLEVNLLITNEEYSVLTDLRKTRNDLIHEAEVIQKDDASRCFNFAHNSLLQRTKAFEGFSEDALSKFIIKKYDPIDFRY